MSLLWDEYTDKVRRSSTRWAVSDRGWLFAADRSNGSLGFYLDYGPDHYRSPHAYCRDTQKCPTCEPGSVLAVACASDTWQHHWFPTIAEARAWLERSAVQGAVAA